MSYTLQQHRKVIKALDKLVPGAKYSISASGLDTLDWQDERPRPSNDEILAAANSLTQNDFLSFNEKLENEIKGIQDKTTRKAAIRIVSILKNLHSLGGSDYVIEELDNSNLPLALKDRIKNLLN